MRGGIKIRLLGLTSWHLPQALLLSYLGVINSNHDEQSCVLPIYQLKILIFNERALDKTQLHINS